MVPPFPAPRDGLKVDAHVMNIPHSSPNSIPGLTLRIAGMTCGGCAAAVGAALRAVPGVGAVRVDLPSGQAQVEAAPALRPALTAAVERVGFRVAAG